ncbi:MAG: DUF2191 domain-containing protein [Actinomycetota bacterium]|nr:DUF2191 domain-containing protein [Actinomycetota bacterium]
MTTSISLDSGLLAAARVEAAATGVSLVAFVEEAIRREISARETTRRFPPRDLPVFAGDGLLPGVDLDNSSDVLDLMEAH